MSKDNFDDDELEKQFRELETGHELEETNGGEDDDLDGLDKEFEEMQAELMREENEAKPVPKDSSKKPADQQIPQKDKAPKQANAAVVEEKFHNEGFFFGDCLNVEIEKIIPGLKKLHESNLDLVIYLSKKEKALMTFK